MKKRIGLDAAAMILTALTLLVVVLWRVDIEADQLAVIAPALWAAGMAAALGLLWGLRRAARRGWSAQRVFLLLFVPLSLGMMLVMPIWRAPDETAHLQRAWQISIGEWFPDSQKQGRFYEPENFFEGVRDHKQTKLYHVIKLRDSQMEMDSLVESNLGANTGIYPITNYFPQALGMAIVRLFTGSRMAIFYGARLAAWLVTLALFYEAVRRMPVGKTLLIAITLMPMMLQEAVSASADGMTCAANAALLAFVAQKCAAPERMDGKETAWLAILMALVGTFKVLYCPMMLLSAAIPAACFGGRRRKRAVLAGTIAAILALTAGWMLFCNAQYVGAGTGKGDVMRAQLAWMAQHPVGFLVVLGRTLFFQFGTYVELLVGKSLSWLNLEIPSLMFWLLVGVLCRIAREDDALGGGNRALRGWGAGLSAACVLILWVSLYIWDTPYANATVICVQGRYFIPLLPALYVALKRGEGAPPERRMQSLKAMTLIDVCVLAFVAIQTVV